MWILWNFFRATHTDANAVASANEEGQLCGEAVEEEKEETKDDNPIDNEIPFRIITPLQRNSAVVAQLLTYVRRDYFETAAGMPNIFISML